eukprot:COSAG01_NODE_1921_length_8901_cov_18.211770_5_plen_304_part_00
METVRQGGLRDHGTDDGHEGWRHADQEEEEEEEQGYGGGGSDENWYGAGGGRGVDEADYYSEESLATAVLAGGTVVMVLTLVLALGGAGGRRAPGAACAASFWAAVLTEIYLCNVCSYQDILRRNGRAPAAPGERRTDPVAAGRAEASRRGGGGGGGGGGGRGKAPGAQNEGRRAAAGRRRRRRRPDPGGVSCEPRCGRCSCRAPGDGSVDAPQRREAPGCPAAQPVSERACEPSPARDSQSQPEIVNHSQEQQLYEYRPPGHCCLKPGRVREWQRLSSVVTHTNQWCVSDRSPRHSGTVHTG